MKKVLGLAGVVAVLLGVWAASAWAQAPAAAPAVAPAAAEHQASDLFSFGGDIRIREEYREEIPPVAPKPGSSQDNYFRFRTRVWGEVDPVDNIGLRVRLCSEFRDWEDPDVSALSQAKTYEWPDELVIDNLYLDFRNLLDKKLDIRIGRQDLMTYGTGKVIRDGTGGDGSRTTFFDAIKASWKGVPETTIDLLGMYNKSDADLIINSADRDLTGYLNALPGESPNESGGGVYLVNKSVQNVQIEVYDIYKEEGAYTSTTTSAMKAWQTLGAAGYENPELKLNTVGLRVAPKFGTYVDGNLEVALQSGDRGDVNAGGCMVDAGLTYRLPVAEKTLAPAVAAGFYYLSGDDPTTAKDEGWDPLYSRYQQNSELFRYDFGGADQAAKWSNIMMPTLTASMTPVKDLKTTATISYVTAPEKDGLGKGTGDVRGMFYQAKAEYTVARNLLRKNDSLAGHLWLEVLDPGSYYASDAEAIFARWEVMYTF